MEIFLVSNNLHENNLTYTDHDDLDTKISTRPLSIEGEILAKNISLLPEFEKVSAIYSSLYSTAIASSKYLANRINKKVFIEEKLNDSKIGILKDKSLSMVRFMQNHDFDIKLNEGESLNEVGNRIEMVINRLVNLNINNKVVLYTHKRTILSYLIKVTKVGYSLDDDIVLEYDEKVVYNEEAKDADIIKLTFNKKKLVSIDVLDV